MKIIDCEQGTKEWLEARAGVVTASRMNDVMAKPKKDVSEAVTRKDYKFQLVAEMLTGSPVEDTYVNRWMQWGIEQEPFARGEYEVKNGVFVEKVGFIRHDAKLYGCSPDGLVGDDGMCEIKCPKTSTHIETLLTGEIPNDYINQMLWQMFVTGRKWCDFVSFDPRLDEDNRLFVKRLMRDDKRISELIAGADSIISDAIKIIGKLKARKQTKTTESKRRNKKCKM